LQTSPENLGGKQPTDSLENTRQQHSKLGGDLESAQKNNWIGGKPCGCLS